WDLAGKGRRELTPGEGAAADRLQFLRGGKALAVTARGVTRLWDVASGKEVPFTLPLGEAAAEARGGKWLAGAAGPGARAPPFWDGESGKELAAFDAPGQVAGLEFVAGGRLLAVQTAGGDVRLYEAADAAAPGREKAALHPATGKDGGVLQRPQPRVT